MSIKSVVVSVEADSPRENVVGVGMSVAAQFDATLAGVSALGIRPPFVAEGVVIDAGGEAEAEQMADLLKIREVWFRHLVQDKFKDAEWRTALELPTEKLVREARTADLIVMSPSSGDPYRSPSIGEVVIRAGRPILVVPDEAKNLEVNRVVIGWKDTRESRRAVHDALPILTRAKEVSLVEIGDDANRRSTLSGLEDVRIYLSKHGIKCGCEYVLSSSGSDGAQLLSLARETHSDLIVTGAYGHTRLGEWIFGGVTRELLFNGKTCCLMSH